MIISGHGISTPLTVKIKPDFKPETTLALQWTQMESGNWFATDRGTGSDKYEVSLNFYGTELTINTLINTLEVNRESSLMSSQITLTGFNTGEHIFGADLDYSGTITANVLSIEQREQHSWLGFALSMRVGAITPPLLSGSGSLPEFRLLDVGYDGDAEYTIQHFRAYNSDYYYNQDNASDIGTFTGTFDFLEEEMAQLKTYLRVTRGAQFLLNNIIGVQYPFGRMSSAYPYWVKMIKFEDQGMSSAYRWRCAITFSQVLA
jgi:hypothetical protein